MIAISAQAGGSDVGVDASALLRWNEGLSDRIMTHRKVDRANTTEKDIEDQQTEREKVYARFLKTFYKDKQFDVQKLEEAQRNYSQYAATYMNKYDESKGSAGPAGIVPFEVGIDLDGISGIKIGQAFKINEGIMPTKYNGAIGFIITGVSHKISNNKWITSLKAQTITLAGFNKPQAKERKEIVIKGFGSTETALDFSQLDLTADWIVLAAQYIKSKEGFLPKAKYDANAFRLGYGTDKVLDPKTNTMRTVVQGDTTTQESATKVLQYEIQNRFYNRIVGRGKNNISSEEFDKLNSKQKAALLSYVYNVGSLRVGIRNAIVAGDYKLAADKIKEGPTTSLGKVLQPLVVRRQEEAALFLS
jgi:GH24 family phage-related lysozyme (muramidase)